MFASSIEVAKATGSVVTGVSGEVTSAVNSTDAALSDEVADAIEFGAAAG